MKRSWKWVFPSVALSAGVAVGLVAAPLDAQQKNLLASKKVSAPPPMEPAMGAAWKDAQPLSVKLVGGKNLPGGSTEVTLRSVYATPCTSSCSVAVFDNAQVRHAYSPGVLKLVFE